LTAVTSLRQNWPKLDSFPTYKKYLPISHHLKKIVIDLSLPYFTGISEEMQSLQSAPPLITLSPFHQSADNT